MELHAVKLAVFVGHGGNRVAALLAITLKPDGSAVTLSPGSSTHQARPCLRR